MAEVSESRELEIVKDGAAFGAVFGPPIAQSAAYPPAMKIIFLAPGLARVKRGMERFFLELAGELRKSGLDAIVWGTSAAPGVEAIRVPSRIELERFAADHLGRIPNLPPASANALQTWALYTEDQLFAIPAAQRLRRMLAQGEFPLVYARWQGGLVDPSGDSTELLKTLAPAIHQGKAALLVHTDYIYPPIDAVLWSAGACFHSLGPWLTGPLRQQGVTTEAIVELPMCIDALPYRAARDHRDSVRAELKIPADAFVVLSVGTFDLVAKRHDYILAELQKLVAQNIYWTVAGSRGSEPAPWQSEAHRVLGARFIALTDVPFAEMPRIYAAADLFTSGSLYETFGLVYLEAQMSGLPVVAHDTPITRHLFSRLPERFNPVSLVDMRRPGAAATAISRWAALLAHPADRKSIHAALDEFSRAQEKHFGWQSIAPQFTAAFQRIAQASAQIAVGRRQPVARADDQLHNQGIQLFQEGKLTDALVFIARSIAARETAERWNDWATVQSALGNPRDAEEGFRRALALSPGHAQAAANLGAVLAAAGRFSEAIPRLEQSLAGLDPAQRPAFTQLLQATRGKLSTKPALNEEEIAAFLAARDSHDDSGPRRAEYIACCTALLNQIPTASPDQSLLGIGPHAEVLVPALKRFHSFAKIEWHTGALEDLSWPLADDSFDVAIFAALESIARDPMHAISEINRVLKPGGLLILTAANIASAKSLQGVLRGATPYIDGRFSSDASAPERHREYTPSEIETLVMAGGFGSIELHTKDIFWKSPESLLTGLVASGFSMAGRGDTIFLRARKESPVRDRFPASLYDLSRMQSRTLQPGSSAPMRILVIFETLPLVEGGGADHRLLQIIRLLREQGHSVTFLAPRSTGDGKRSAVLDQLGVKVYIEDAEVLRLERVDLMPKWTLQDVLREGQFDLALVSLWFWMGVTLPEYYLDEIRRLSPATRVAVLTDDCHGIREEGGAEISGLWSDRERAVDFAERETEIYSCADLVISISDSDRQKIAREVGSVPIEVLPMMVESGPAAPGFAPREGIVYLGHFNNPPTLDGLEWYIREVAPLVRRELPDVKLYVLGAQLPENWTSPDPNVVRVGFRSDLAAEFAQRRILVSPVRFGTGIKTKNLHAIAHGLPIVTNEKGAEGANFLSGENALIAESPQEFAAAVVNLYTDEALWTKLSQNSRAHAAKYFSRDAMDAALRGILDRARASRPQPYDPNHVWSVRLVEKMFAEVSNYQPAAQRHSIRVLAYARAAEELLAKGQRAEARRQLRHVFNYFSHSVSRTIFFGSLLGVAESMDRTYRALGEIEGAEEFRREGRESSASAFVEGKTAKPPARSAELDSAPTRVPDLPVGCLPKAVAVAKESPKSRRNGKHAGKLDFSVVLPTYNRAEVLAECLGALNRQSLSPQRFEVIVVDDGSTDTTPRLCSHHQPRHEFLYLKQQNAGAGAARRIGVQRARGKFLLLINDDTIANRELLAQHLELQRAHAGEKIAVLGNFHYSEAAKSRALTWFLTTQPFLFPQVGLKPGVYTNHSFFITCNISVRRDLVLAAGSFDADFRVAEDTELGVRLMQRGLKVLYAPELDAIHEHLDFAIADLIRRAEIYGAKLVTLFEKHPNLVADGKGVLGTLDANSLSKIDSFIKEHEAEIPAAMESLAKFDSIDFTPFFSRQIEDRNAAEIVIDLFTRSVPTVYWYHLFRSFLNARNAGASSSVDESPLPSATERIAL
jgi:glycosyltransferase involved in cell wall biosynthesis/SAM-dependent methyltransferase